MSCPKQPTSEFDPGEFFQAAVFLSKMTLLRLRLRVLGYSIRKKVPHGSIKQIMGFHSSNWQANHRVMQIARDEISNELRVMQQLLPSVMCGHLGPNYDRHAAFRFLQESASTLLSDSWNHFLRHLRNGGDVSTKAQPEPPINLSGVTLSPATESLLAHGPKFAPPVNSSRVDELASVYEIAAKIPEDSRQDFVGAGTRAVCFHGGSRRAKNASTPVIKELQAGELSLLQADKTGQFVILNKQQMQEKSDEALKKNFIGLKTRPSGSLRSRVKAMCDSSNLPSLKSAVLAPAKQYLSIFFSAKTHKPGVPFRSIVSETGCWQRPLAKFLQKHLGTLELPQPFRLRNSEDLLPVLDELHAGTEAVRAFSLDVVDLYYSLNVKTLLGFISDAIHETGVIDFQNSCGVSLSSFLELTQLYLQSTLVEYEGKVYIQRAGVCIGSCLAPVLSEIYLFYVDAKVQADLQRDFPDAKVFRYVDDYLILHSAISDSAAIETVFQKNSHGLTFTKEAPSPEGLQFLDLRLVPTSKGICWAHQQRSSKPVLPFNSSHSRNVKNGIVRNLVASAKVKSCQHLSAPSLSKQISRLIKAGYPRDLIETTIKRLVAGQKSKPLPPKSRFACIPYIHNTSHRLKSIALGFNTNVVFSCKFKLASICRKVNNPGPAPPCQKKHQTNYVTCCKECVYSIPMSCGAKYIGQTGRCLNDRVREHANEIKKAASDTSEICYHPIAKHTSECSEPCSADLPSTTRIGGHASRYGREIMEAFAMHYSRSNFGSPSIGLSRREI
ncbi:uncharacterized protein LOC121838063, partial [Ixodes scapularis]|uniref:uncharacterized protein LOC121838063 n=1 Tax=Ixodes scapularis TaxID=6945 RepID=UPI001C394A7F